jgi:aspartate aminotransferase
MRIVPRAADISLSATLALDARAKARAAAGHDVINMSVGEPDFPAPAIVQEAACARVRSGDVRYTPAAGMPALRKAIAAHLSATRGGTFAAEQVTVCHSTKHALSGAVLATVQAGDEALLILPAWVSYVEIVPHRRRHAGRRGRAPGHGARLRRDPRRDPRRARA